MGKLKPVSIKLRILRETLTRNSVYGRTNQYQKAVKIENPCAVTMTPIEAAAQAHCPILSSSPLTVPGPPIRSFILSPSNQRNENEMPRDVKQCQTPFRSLVSLLRMRHYRLDWSWWEEEVEDLGRSSDWDSAATTSWSQITFQQNSNPTKSLARRERNSWNVLEI